MKAEEEARVAAEAQAKAEEEARMKAEEEARVAAEAQAKAEEEEETSVKPKLKGKVEYSRNLLSFC